MPHAGQRPLTSGNPHAPASSPCVTTVSDIARVPRFRSHVEERGFYSERRDLPGGFAEPDVADGVGGLVDALSDRYGDRARVFVLAERDRDDVDHRAAHAITPRAA